MLSSAIAHKEVPASFFDTNPFMPLEILDLLMPQTYFTVGVVVDFEPPTKSKSGKVFSTFKLSTLVKYDVIRLKKHVVTPYYQL